MPRLPAVLEPAFPLLKRAHRATTRGVGRAARAYARRRPGPRTVPWRGTTSSAQTAALEPEAVRLHVTGGAGRVERTPPLGWPPDHPETRTWGGLEVADRYVLEIADGRVYTRNGVHVTPGGTLDYATSTYFGVASWEEHPIFLPGRLPRAEHLDGTVLSLATRGTWGNYYHVLLDLLPRWGIARECLPGLQPDVFLLNRGTSYARELLDLVGLGDVPAIEPTATSGYRADRLLVPCLDNNHNEAPPHLTDWLRTHLPARRTSGRPRRLYVTRGQARNTRRVVNEAAVLDVLRPLGFEVIDPGTLPVQEQIDHFAAAEVVVAPHGAALANLTFCPPGVRVLELFAPRYVNRGYWSIVQNLPDATYRYLLGAGHGPRDGVMNGVLDDITVDLATLAVALDDLLSPDPEKRHL